MKPYDVALIDFDGCIADSQWFWATYIPSVLEKNGYPVTEAEKQRCLHLPYPRQTAYFKAKFGLEKLPDTDLETKFSAVEEFYTTYLTWKPTVPEFLGLLKERGIRTYVFSGTPVWLLEKGVAHLKGDALLDGLFCEGDFGLAKNNPQVFGQILSAVNGVPERAMFIDDLVENVRAAKTAGLTAFGVGDLCRRGDEELFRSFADGYAEQMIGLREFLGF